MDNTPRFEEENAQLEQINPETLGNWSSTGENDNNSTLVYIAVQYVKNAKQGIANTSPSPKTEEVYTDVTTTPRVSPLDPNMSSVARYSPLSVQYQDQQVNSELAPVIIQQYVSQENPEHEDFLNQAMAENTLEDLSPSALCTGDLQTGERQYLEMLENGSVNICENEDMHLNSENDPQEVELLITDHATGISYTISAQEFLSGRCLEDDQPLLEAIPPNSILESDLFSLDDTSSKSDLNNATIHPAEITSANEEIVKNYIDCFTNCNIICPTSEDKVHTRSSCMSNADEEERLLSSVYTITDKPILSRARASLPESYLSIVKINGDDAVIAKKVISRRTQFGPLKGVLHRTKKDDSNSNIFFLVVDAYVYSVDVSDESNSNWMSFIRKAVTYEEQNLIISQEGDGLYFTTTRNIMPKEELKVGYSASYAKQFNLELLKPTEKKSWSCYECLDEFSSSAEFQKHLDVHDQERDENTRPKRKTKKANSARLDKLPIGVVECNLCHDMFNAMVSYNTLKNHLAEKHKLVGVKAGEHFSIQQCFQCNICNMRFRIEVLLNIHKVEHDPELPLDLPNHVCPLCQRKFPTRKQLILHVSTHALSKNIKKDDSVKCPVCHKLFSHSIRLQKHMLCHGSDENKPLQCKVCKKRFLTASALAFHGKVHMVGEKHFECPICKERFDHVLKLRLHIPKHMHNNVYTCPHCKKTYGKYSIIKKHIRFHNERKYHCTQCPKSFPTQENLKKHMLRHSDHKEFLCADCGRQFKRKDKLADHIKKLHLQGCSNRIPKVRTPSQTSTKEPMDFHRFIFKCHTCLLGFKRRGMLVNHLAKRHPDIRPDSVPELNLPILQTTRDYYCQYCDKVYKSSSKRKMHILKNHPGAALPVKNSQKTAEQAGVSSSSLSTSASVTTRPKNCQWCHRQYARKGKLLQHIRKAHPSKLMEENGLPKENYKNTDTASVSSKSVGPENKITDLPKPFASIAKTVETSFIMNPSNEFPDVLQKSQITTDGNMTEITPAVIDGLIDDDSRFCHLAIDENGVIESAELENQNAQLYQLLSSSNGIIPSQ